jgi:dTDP-4-dehydrorhamnose 3,5-epimerase
MNGDIFLNPTVKSNLKIKVSSLILFKTTNRCPKQEASPFEQGKLIRVIQGKVLDVAVDIRKNSATFGQHFTVELGGDTHKMLWIPPGFLHGFITLEDNTIFTYKVTNLYNKDFEIGLRWDDPDLGIDWQLDRTKIILSEKDKALPAWKEFESPF